MGIALKILAAVALAATALSCRPAAPLRGQTPVPRPEPATSAAGSASEPARPSSVPSSPSVPPVAPRIVAKTISGIRFEGVAYDSRTHRLEVVDQKTGPGTRFSEAEDVARRTDAMLAINGGFFTPEGKPLGLVVSGGETSGAWNSASSLGSAIYRTDSSGDSEITRRSSRQAVAGSRELLQTGPLLVENGSLVSGLDSTKSAVRSIIVTDGGNRWWVGKTSPCDLTGLGRALASASPAGWPVQAALNLDGGRSTDLFISPEIPGGPFKYRSFLNRPVRNFLILKPR